MYTVAWLPSKQQLTMTHMGCYYKWPCKKIYLCIFNEKWCTDYEFRFEKLVAHLNASFVGLIFHSVSSGLHYSLVKLPAKNTRSIREKNTDQLAFFKTPNRTLKDVQACWNHWAAVMLEKSNNTVVVVAHVRNMLLLHHLSSLTCADTQTAPLKWL